MLCNRGYSFPYLHFSSLAFFALYTYSRYSVDPPFAQCVCILLLAFIPEDIHQAKMDAGTVIVITLSPAVAYYKVGNFETVDLN